MIAHPDPHHLVAEPGSGTCKPGILSFSQNRGSLSEGTLCGTSLAVRIMTMTANCFKLACSLLCRPNYFRFGWLLVSHAMSGLLHVSASAVLHVSWGLLLLFTSKAPRSCLAGVTGCQDERFRSAAPTSPWRLTMATCFSQYSPMMTAA